MAADDPQVREIHEWFAYRGYELWLHEYQGTWRAPYMPLGSRFGAAAFGSGATPLEAAQTAKEQFEREHPPPAVRQTTTFFIDAQDTGAAIEDEIEVEQLSEQNIDEEIALDREQVEAVAEQLLGYGWGLWFEPEPDGKITAVVKADETGEVLRTLLCEDHEDAFLQLGIELRPPSEEVRQAQEKGREQQERE